MQLDLNQLRELLAILNQTDIAELTLKGNDFELTVRKGDRSSAQAVITSDAAASVVSSKESAAPPPEAAQPSGDKSWIEVISPMVGTFYRSPAPDDPPFVEVDDPIRRGQTVCIIEAMKLMNELEAEVNGVVKEILVENGQPIEYGQPLMRVDPR